MTQIILNTDAIIDSIRNCSKIEYEIPNGFFEFNEYQFNPCPGYQLAIDVDICVCYFRLIENGVKNYTLNKPIIELTEFEKSLIINHCNFFADVLS